LASDLFVSQFERRRTVGWISFLRVVGLNCERSRRIV